MANKMVKYGPVYPLNFEGKKSNELCSKCGKPKNTFVAGEQKSPHIKYCEECGQPLGN